MSTLSVPLQPHHEELIESLVTKGVAANKADVVRKALNLLAEEEAVMSVLKSEQEVRDGKILKGDLKELAAKIN